MITLDDFLARKHPVPDDRNECVTVHSDAGTTISIYPRSIFRLQGVTLFIGRLRKEKRLFLRSVTGNEGPFSRLVGDAVPGNAGQGSFRACALSHQNARVIQDLLDFTRPIIVGLRQSFGFGDRLGVANAAHIRSLASSGFVPVLAQQSIRELSRTRRTAEEVMDAAVWASIQEGYTGGFGADADHLKTTADIDRMVEAGFTMFTFDPSEHVVNAADAMDESALERHAATLPWDRLSDSFDGLLKRYQAVSTPLTPSFTIKPSRVEILRALVKYGSSLAHIRLLYNHLVTAHPSHPREVEVSVDETDSVTSPFEHFFIASELNRLDVDFISLAPRFVGEFEKGIDYKGSVSAFTEEYLRHVAIAQKLGPYKISFHSGSDKFAVYAAVGRTGAGNVHVKTAGTSYLEALRVVATRDAALFREILDFSRGLYEQEKASYHVSAQLTRVLPGASYADSELVGLLDANDARQVLHVTFGKVLTNPPEGGRPSFKDRLLDCLDENEGLHYEYLAKHFRRHLEPLEPLVGVPLSQATVNA